MDKKNGSPYNEWCIGTFPGLCTIVFKTSTRYLKYFALFGSGGFKQFKRSILALLTQNFRYFVCRPQNLHTQTLQFSRKYRTNMTYVQSQNTYIFSHIYATVKNSILCM